MREPFSRPPGSLASTRRMDGGGLGAELLGGAAVPLWDLHLRVSGSAVVSWAGRRSARNHGTFTGP